MPEDELAPRFRNDIRRAAELIRGAGAMLFTAGAGMGVDSGLPDFRGSEGFWRAYPPYQRLNVKFQQVATPRLLVSDPELFWGFYGHRQALYRRTQPHAGFGILHRWAGGAAGGAFVFTSNVDGHFQRAGFAADRVVECHGTLEHHQCGTPCCEEIWDAAESVTQVDLTTMRAVRPLPACKRCGGPARPNILMFNDGGWLPERTGRQETHYQRWLAGLGNPRLVVIECGAGVSIPTVRSEGECVARERGGTLIRINPRDADVPANAIGIPLPSLAALRLIDEAMTTAG